MSTPRRLLTIGHSYCVAQNRRLAHEMALVDPKRWTVTVAAPAAFPGDLRFISLERMSGEASAVVPVPVHWANRIHLMRYGRRLRELLREHWDIVHAWEEPFIVAGGQIAWNVQRGVPLVYSSFQNIVKWYPPPFGWIERYSLGRAAGWIAFGSTVQDILSRKPAYSRLPSRIIPPGVDIDSFQPDPGARERVLSSLGWMAGPPIIGFVGRFIPAKGIGLLMKSLTSLPIPWRAMFVGGGPMQSEISDWRRSLPQPDNVRIVNDVSHDGVAEYLNAMDIVAMPSQTTPQWREQLGRVLIEAMACGRTIVASDSGEIPHVVGDAGIILSESDEAAWNHGLAEIIDSPERRAAFGKSARQWAVEHFAWSVVARRHIEFFDHLLAAGRSASP